MDDLIDFITHPMIWISVGAVIVYFILRHMFGSTCPACRERRALEMTGRHEAAGFMYSGETEYKCKYCGHALWKSDPIGGV